MTVRGLFVYKCLFPGKHNGKMFMMNGGHPFGIRRFVETKITLQKSGAFGTKSVFIRRFVVDMVLSGCSVKVVLERTRLLF